MRVLGSPSALRTKEPRTEDRGATGGGAGAGSPWTRFFLAKVPWYIPGSTGTGLWAPNPTRANR
jgi:hypothetical protein